MPTGRESTTSTEAPRRASSYATAHPTIPAPTTTMSEGRDDILCFQLNPPPDDRYILPAFTTTQHSRRTYGCRVRERAHPAAARTLPRARAAVRSGEPVLPGGF